MNDNLSSLIPEISSTNGCLIFLLGQVDLDLLRCQQLKLYILKAGRALLSHQDTLRQILSQPAVQECASNPAGILECYLTVLVFVKMVDRVCSHNPC